MAYPIKYIEHNLVFNHDGECFAYYELLPYNYSFLSPEQKYQVHDSFRQLIAQNRDGKIHALQISTESSIRAAQERSKQEVTGKLKDVACTKIDAQTEALISMIGGFVIAHRLSTIRNSNAIIVLDHGRIIERGDHDDLIQQKGTYYQLYTGKLELS